jgi:apolipoprotein N-acyltransferase
MALAVLHTGHLLPGTKFLENEAVLIGPDGTVLNVFHKNNPVPMAEASLPGDGIIPVTGTPFGNLATSICYDADFPDQMRQLGRKQADMLLLPSGDWYAISPYHTYMAILRGIENGCSVIRQVSGGLSVATDYTGRIHASLDYFLPGIKAWTGEVPVGHVFTPYTVVGDALANGCLAVSAAILVMLLVDGWKRIRRQKGAVSGNLSGS